MSPGVASPGLQAKNAEQGNGGWLRYDEVLLLAPDVEKLDE
jgi:hypothetical protein